MNKWLILLTAIISFAAAWTAQGWRKENQILDLKLEISQSALDQAMEARKRTKARQDAVAKIDAQQTKELKNAQAEINRMRLALSNGTGSLQLNAVCPDRSGLTINPGLDNGAGPRLTDSARENYFLLREGIAQVTKQLTAAQEILLICGNSKGQPDKDRPTGQP